MPRGDRQDGTRAPAVYDDIAAVLLACGAETLADEVYEAPEAATAQPVLL